MRTFNRREQKILAAAFLVMSTLAVDRFVWSPLWKGWRQLNASIVEKRMELGQDQRLLKDRDKIRRDYAALALARQEGTENPGSEKTTELVRDIEALTSRSGLKISDLKPQTLQGLAGQNRSVHLVVESSWDSLARFIYEVQRSPRLLRIEKVGIQRKSDEAELLMAQFVIGTARGVE